MAESKWKLRWDYEVESERERERERVPLCLCVFLPPDENMVSFGVWHWKTQNISLHIRLRKEREKNSYEMHISIISRTINLGTVCALIDANWTNTRRGRGRERGREQPKWYKQQTQHMNETTSQTNSLQQKKSGRKKKVQFKVGEKVRNIRRKPQASNDVGAFFSSLFWTKWNIAAFQLVRTVSSVVSYRQK